MREKEAVCKCSLCGRDLCEKHNYEFVPSLKDSGMKDDYSVLKNLSFCTWHFGLDGGFYPKKGL